MSTLAGTLVRAFGDVAAMQQLYANDVRWTLPISLGRIGGTHEGKDAVTAFNKISLGSYKKPSDIEVEIHDEMNSEGGVSMARFTCRSTVAATDEAYENEYMIIVRERDGKVAEVIEYLDTLKLMQYKGLRRYLPPIAGVVVT